MTNFFGIEYGRGACATPIDGGPTLAPATIKKMFPNHDWTTLVPEPFNLQKCIRDRFGENFEIQKKIVATTPDEFHIMIGGDHSLNYGHFTALANRLTDEDLCLIYIDAHLDIHSPETSLAQATGAPHGTNVRALMGDGDARWLTLRNGNAPALRPENVFFLGTRDYEPAEIEFVQQNNIFVRRPDELRTESDWSRATSEIKRAIGARPYVLSFDFDAIDPRYFRDVLVPAPNGISVDAAEYFIRAFAPDAHGIEFVEYAPSGDAQSAKIVQQLISLVAA